MLGQASCTTPTLLSPALTNGCRQHARISSSGGGGLERRMQAIMQCNANALAVVLLLLPKNTCTLETVIFSAGTSSYIPCHLCSLVPLVPPWEALRPASYREAAANAKTNIQAEYSTSPLPDRCMLHWSMRHQRHQNTRSKQRTSTLKNAAAHGMRSSDVRQCSCSIARRAQTPHLACNPYAHGHGPGDWRPQRAHALLQR